MVEYRRYKLKNVISYYLNRTEQAVMSNEAKKPLSLSKGKLELKKTVETGQVRQTFSHGRTKVVQVERKRKRQFEMGADGKVQAVSSKASGQISKSLQNIQTDINQEKIHNEETAQRIRVLQQAKQEREDSKKVTEIISEKLVEINKVKRIPMINPIYTTFLATIFP